MGLELKEIVRSNLEEHDGLGTGIGIAAAALGIILVVRAGYVAALVWLQSRRARSKQRQRLEMMSERLDEVASGEQPIGRAARGRTPRPGDERRMQRRIDNMRLRITRALSDLDYYQASPLGWKHGTVIVWAGMRGVVTLAAAQTIPRDLETDRPLLIFIAFCVAAGSLMLQGFTLPWLVRRLHFEQTNDDLLDQNEQSSLDDELRDAAREALSQSTIARRDGSPFPDELLERMGTRYSEPPDEDKSVQFRDALELRYALIEAMRSRLNELSSGGSYSTAALRHALAELDADQLSLQLRLDDES
jgi:CPA1 family monovalent cation:H+ antiporter